MSTFLSYYIFIRLRVLAGAFMLNVCLLLCSFGQDASPRLASDQPPGPSSLKRAIIYTTARDTGERLHPGTPQTFTADAQPAEMTPGVLVDPARRYQSIVGFGGALTDAAAETYARLPVERQREFLNACYSVERGLGYTLARTHIGSCDFSSESYSYAETPGDTALAGFSIAHDLDEKLPFIKAAIAAAGGKLSIFASPWSPPAWMKTNNSMQQGGKLRPEYRQAWADYYVRFIRAYEGQGVPIWGLTVQNEEMAAQRWESCVYTAEEEKEFVRDYLGPTLHRAGLAGVKLMIWDHNRGLLYQRAAAVLSDPAVARYVWGSAFHWYPYPGNSFENVRQVRDAFPDKALLFTEGCVEDFQSAGLDDWKLGERYGLHELTDLDNGANGWTDWNVLLDEHGGPNHTGNYCYAPIHADTKTGELHYTNSYYYLGHFSRFIRPGAQRIACAVNGDALRATAFVNPDATVAVVVLNLTDEACDYKIGVNGLAVSVRNPAHSIATVILE